MVFPDGDKVKQGLPGMPDGILLSLLVKMDREGDYPSDVSMMFPDTYGVNRIENSLMVREAVDGDNFNQLKRMINNMEVSPKHEAPRTSPTLTGFRRPRL